MLAVEYNLGRVVGETGAAGANGRSTWIKYNTAPQDSGATITWSSGQNYIGIQSVVAATHPATGYTWSLFIPQAKLPIRTATLVVGFDDNCDFNVKDYNGTDYTNSSQTVINAAISALPSAGGKITLREGTYNVTSSIALNKANTTLEGMGNSTILKRMSDSVSEIFYISVNNCGIEKLCLDGNRTVYTAVSNYGINTTSSADYISITNNTFKNSMNGIRLGGKYNVVSTNICIDNDCAIFTVNSLSERNTITGNTCNRNASHGIYINSTNDTITGNTCTGNALYGIYCFGVDATVSGNTCDYNYHGIYSRSGFTTITGNTCNRNASHGIYCSGSNPVITGNCSAVNEGYGIRIGGSYALCVSNQVYNNTEGAIYTSFADGLIINNKNGASNNLTNGVWT